MKALGILALAFVACVWLVISGLVQLFRSSYSPEERYDDHEHDGDIHITYNVNIKNSFNGRNDDHDTRKTKAADDGEFSSIFKRNDRY